MRVTADSFRVELDRVCARIVRRDPMALYRFGDGELLLADGLAVGPHTQAAQTDRWQAPARLTRLGTDLRTVLATQGPWAHFGIPCPCCNDAGFRRLVAAIRRSPLVPANLFINANYRPFRRWLATIREAAVVTNETGTIDRFPFPVVRRLTVPDDGVSYYERHRDVLLARARHFCEALPPRTIVLVAAGPLSEALIFFMWNHCPHHVYVDVGSALDELSYGRPTRPYMHEGDPYASRQCGLPPRTEPVLIHEAFQDTTGNVTAALDHDPVPVPAPAAAHAATTNARLGLVMIVKNEKDVLARCLRSVRPLLKHWVIVDTGSTDGTQVIAQEELRGIPGQLVERPWVDFATNRNMAIALGRGKASHSLMIDADDVLVLDSDFQLPHLTFDSFEIRVQHDTLVHWRPHIFRSTMPFHYEGVLHEWMNVPPASSSQQLHGLTMQIVGGGSRSKDPDKFLRDAELLERALVKEPTHTRYAFYLGQSYRDHYRMNSKPEFLERAIEAYTRRVNLTGGFVEEVYHSLLEIAHAHRDLQHEAEVIPAYLKAFEARSTRAEPLYHLARYLRGQARFGLAVTLARHAMTLALPSSDRLFVEEQVYRWGTIDEFAISASYFDHLLAEGKAANEKLLTLAPAVEHDRIRKNLKICGG